MVIYINIYIYIFYIYIYIFFIFLYFYISYFFLCFFFYIFIYLLLICCLFFICIFVPFVPICILVLPVHLHFPIKTISSKVFKSKVKKSRSIKMDYFYYISN